MEQVTIDCKGETCIIINLIRISIKIYITVLFCIHTGFNIQVLTSKSKVISLLTISMNISDICAQQSNIDKYSDIPDIITIEADIRLTINNKFYIL